MSKPQTLEFDVLIVGGGVSGLSCAITLLSAKEHYEFVREKRIGVVDEGNSDLLKAYLKNVPGIKEQEGEELLKSLREQLKRFGGCPLIKDKVVKVEERFKVFTEGGKVLSSEYLVLATGFHRFEINIRGVEVLENPNSPRPGKVMLKNENFKVKDKLFVCGTLSGAPSMVSIASGTGVWVALQILREWSGKSLVIHDVKGSV